MIFDNSFLLELSRGVRAHRIGLDFFTKEKFETS